MLDTNPYAAPQERVESKARRTGAGRFWVRLVLWTHVAVIVYCAVLTLADTRLLQLPDAWQWLIYQAAPVAVFSWFVFPVMMGIVAYWSGESASGWVAMFALDVVLSIFQLWVMLPLVQ
jgi:hypothetical protein